MCYHASMLRTLQYRIYPTHAQRRALDVTLEECRWVYNETLATRKQAWEEQGQTLRYYDTAPLLPLWKMERPSLRQVNAQVLQNVMVRVDLAFAGFFRRAKTVKPGEKPGYPR